MSFDVDVALIADPGAPFEPGVLDDRFYAMPYGRRRRVTLAADDDEALASVLERAADAMGLRLPADDWRGQSFNARYQKVAFYVPGDEVGFVERARPRINWGELVLVDSDGRAIIGVHDMRAVRYRDLFRASEAGVLEGDPLKPYLILDDGWGDWPGIDLVDLGQGLDVAWEVLKATAVVTGAATGAQKAYGWARERLNRGREALRANSAWGQRGHRPDQIATLASVRAWSTPELAALLGCSESEAEGILWVLGFTADDDTGYWRRGGDDAAEMLGQILQAIAWTVHGGEGWEQRFRDWLAQYVRSGVAPPFDSSPNEDLEEPEVALSPTLGERVDELVEFARRLITRRPS